MEIATGPHGTHRLLSCRWSMRFIKVDLRQSGGGSGHATRDTKQVVRVI